MGIITVIGSLNMDLVVRTPTMPAAGETLAGTDFHMIPGGKGANQAVAAAQAGAVTRMVGCVGGDAFGPALLESLSQVGVDVTGVHRIQNTSTGFATIIVENGGENRIIIVAGANGKVSSRFIQDQWATIQQSDLILLQHEIPLETVHAVIRKARTSGIRIVLNAAPIYPIPSSILSLVDILIVNEVEAAAMTGLQVVDAPSARTAAHKLHQQGAASVIVTLGSTGSVLYNTRFDLYQPAFILDQVDTTAAGDTFTGSYAASILEGKSPPDALQYASAAAALSVTRLGAQTSIPGRGDVDAFLAQRVGVMDLSSLTRKDGGV